MNLVMAKTHLTENDTPIMYRVYHMSLNDLEKKDFDGLKEIYQPSSPNQKLSHEVIRILDDDGTRKDICLKRPISYYQEISVVCARMSYLFHRIYCMDPEKNAHAVQYFEACQLNQNRIQSVLNQLIYKHQIRVAYLALVLTVIFSIVSIVFALYGIHHPSENACSCPLYAFLV